MEVQIIKDFIPEGRGNRPAYPMTPQYITIHETGNFSKGANAKAHASYIKSDSAAKAPVSWHFTVDDTIIYQHLPLNENSWNAGDGINGTGNRKSIAIEICVNPETVFTKAVENTQWLVRKLMKEYNIPIENIKQHYDWNGKNCPYTIRKQPNGWKNFLEGLQDKPQNPATPKPSPLSFKVGDIVYFKGTTHFVSSTATSGSPCKQGKAQITAIAPNARHPYHLKRVAGGTSTVYGWVNKSDVISLSDTPVQPQPTPQPPKTIKVGSKVKVKKGAKTYTGGNLASFVYNNVYDVLEIKGDRVVIGIGKAVTAAIHKDNLILQ